MAARTHESIIIIAIPVMKIPFSNSCISVKNCPKLSRVALETPEMKVNMMQVMLNWLIAWQDILRIRLLTTSPGHLIKDQ